MAKTGNASTHPARSKSRETRSGAYLRGLRAVFLPPFPEPFVSAAVGLTHGLRTVWIIKKSRAKLLLTRQQALMRNRLHAATMLAAGLCTASFAAGRIDRASGNQICRRRGLNHIFAGVSRVSAGAQCHRGHCGDCNKGKLHLYGS